MNELRKERKLGAARAALAEVVEETKGREERWREGWRQDEPLERVETASLTCGEPSSADLSSLAAADDVAARRRLFIRMTLINDYRLSSAFIPVPKLALILGMSPSTIWSHMRQKRFPIPYRLFNTTPMVCIDDLVDWYCAKDDLILPDTDPAPRRSVKQEAEDEGRRRAAETEDLVANALATLGINPSRRKGPR